MLWAQLAGILAVAAFYVRFLVDAGPGRHYFHAVLLVLLFLFGAVSLVARRRNDHVVEDERDRSIAATGARWSNTILWIGLVVILVLYWDRGSMRSAHLLVGVLFHLMLLAGCARIARELIAYRMSA